ncbi:hypothetical protein ACFX2G_033099 [Malus domestica]
MARTRQRWKTLNNGWVKCNFDEAWNGMTKIGGFGVVIRDHNGNFLAATSGNLENIDAKIILTHKFNPLLTIVIQV